MLVIAWGAVLRTIADFIIGSRSGGWFGYAPNTEVIFDPSGMSPGPRALVWVVTIALWAGGAVWLLADRTSGPDEHP